MGNENGNEIAKQIGAARGILTSAWGRPVTLGKPEILREKYRNSVLRCAVIDAPAGSPETVIIKASVGSGDDAYDPSKDQAGSTSSRFFNEVAGTQFLNSVVTYPPLAPALYGGAPAYGVFVIQDLGPGEALADRLQGSDRAKLEAGLLAYAGSMGRMHSATAGRAEEFEAIRAKFSGHSRSGHSRGAEWLQDRIPAFRRDIEAIGIHAAPSFDMEATDIAAGIDNPGPFLAFTPGDTCPDNHRFVTENDLCFFDFEHASFQHALLDAAYFCMPFPTCWCVNRVPDDLVGRMIDTYRRALSPGCPTAADDDVFYPALTQACVFWLISTLSWHFESALKEDSEWGISTIRQRHLLRLTNTIRLLKRTGEYQGIRDTASHILTYLQAEWPEVEMPLYPALRAS